MVLVGKPEGSWPPGIHRCKWDDNIKIDLRENKMEWYRLDLSGSDQGPDAGSCEHGNDWGSINCWEILE
jgi:hypothetical protein